MRASGRGGSRDRTLNVSSPVKASDEPEVSESEEELRAAVMAAVRRHFAKKHGTRKPFERGDRIPYGGRVFDEQEVIASVDASLDFWLTSGRFSEEFATGLARYLGVRNCVLTNSGSSANLIAFMALTSPMLSDRRILPGDEVIAVATGFPTTVAPIVQYGAIPVFLDVTIPGYNLDVSALDAALSERTRAVMVAHTLGNPFDLTTVKAFCKRHQLWLVEDNCDALGSRYRIGNEWKYTGTFGDIGTSSFFPSHHITTGEGGALYMGSPLLKRIAESFRDWGRDCWCTPGNDNTCGKRFSHQLGDVPFGYDHKYIYSHFGYNLKLTEMQAAIGAAQLKKLPELCAARRRNWGILKDGLASLQDRLVLPEATPDSDPSWFGFAVTVRPDAGFTRAGLTSSLESRGIQTRPLFAGNLLRHPCFDEMRQTGRGYRVVGSLENADLIMNQTFWLGVYSGMSDAMLEYIIEHIHDFCRR